MNILLLSTFLSIGVGLIFAFLGGDAVLGANVTAFLTVESIMAAAVLVRLNRGIPTVDWKSVDSDALERLLDEVEQIANEYAKTLILIVVSMCFAISVLFVAQQCLVYGLEWKRGLSIAFGVTLGLLLSRMAYIVWLDLDIVRLQRAVIVSAAAVEDGKKQQEIAANKLNEIGSTRVPRKE